MRLEIANKEFPCPCCGHMSFEEKGCYEICGICGWEDDPVQLTNPLCGGANPPLADCQKNYKETGCKRPDPSGKISALGLIREPVEGDVKDPGWYPLTDETIEKMGGKELSNLEYFHASCQADEEYYWRRFPKTV